MHLSSYEHMDELAKQYLGTRSPGIVFDIGSQDVNGSYKPIFTAMQWRYVGVDAEAGNNVDLVIPTPYRYPVPRRSVDVIISGQAFEHIGYFWLSWLEMIRITKVGGYIFLIAPSRGPEHRYPIDCWRFYPDGFQALADWGGLQLLHVTTDWQPHPDADSAHWGDTVGVFQKTPLGLKRQVAMGLVQWAGHFLAP